MIQECKFDPLSDVEAVVPSLAVDVAEVMATHVVVSTGDTTPYTKETDVNEVGHYIGDKIQATIIAMNMRKSMAAASKSTSSPSTAAPSTPKEGE